MWRIGKKAIEFLRVACNAPNNHPCHVSELYGRSRRGNHVVVALVTNGLLEHYGNGYYQATKKGKKVIRSQDNPSHIRSR